MGYGYPCPSLEVFLGSMGSANNLRPVGLRSTSVSELTVFRICLENPPTPLNRATPTPGLLTLLRHPIVITIHGQCGNIKPLPINYAFRPRLRGRLTLSGLTCLRNPWVYGDRVSHPVYRYSCQHSHFHAVQPSLSVDLHPTWNAPLPLPLRKVRDFGAGLEPR